MHLPIVPEPSKLYSLKPEGIGTPDVESLASYAMRLAESHCLDLCDLIGRFIHPLIGSVWRSTRARRGINKVHHAYTHTVTPAHIHVDKWLGMTEETQATVTALSELTKRQNLHLLTLLPLKGYVRQETVLRYQFAWCPCCYEDQKNAGEPVYVPLSWSFKDVRICRNHQQILWTACFWCSAMQQTLHFRSQPGYCIRCGLWLGKKPTRPSKITSQDIWNADAVGNLIANWTNLPPQPENPLTIESLLNRSYGGKQ